MEEGTEGGSRGTGQVTDMRLEVTKDDNQGREKTCGDAEAGGRPDGEGLTGGTPQHWLDTLPFRSFNGEGAAKQSVAWHLQVWAMGTDRTARLHGPGFCWILWAGGESGASKKVRVGF